MTICGAYNDEYLTYDRLLKEYVLTLSYAKSIIGNAYTDDGVMQRRLIKNSNVVYNYIYNNGNSKNKETTMKILNATKEGRELISKALVAQIMADAENGYNDLGNQNPIDFTNGNVIDREEIRKNKVCIDCEDILQNSASDLEGYNVMCAIPYPQMVHNIFKGVKC